MSSYVDGFVASRTQADGLHVVPQELWDSYPSLAQALAGFKQDGEHPIYVPPIKVLLNAECGRIEACLLTYKGGTKAFVTLSSTHPWEQSLEDLLASGNIPWKK
jgi:hypothetical protein